jgi:hypothetical protein
MNWTMSRRAAVLLAVGLVVVGCSPAGDVTASGAPIPAGYADVVSSARTSLLQNIDGFVRPALAFAELRCFADGGRVVLFQEVGGANAGRTDWAMQGAGAVAGPDGWAGGLGADGLQEEIDFNFGDAAPVACPPR